VRRVQLRARGPAKRGAGNSQVEAVGSRLPCCASPGSACCILDFVWGGKSSHAVRADIVFLPTRLGGLGAIDPVAIDTANSLRFLDRLLAPCATLWHDLALGSLRRSRLVMKDPTISVRPAETWPWALFRPVATPPATSDDCFWHRIAAAARSHPPTIDPALLSTASALSLPPALFSPDPRLRSFHALAALYYQDSLAELPPGYYSLPLSLPRTAPAQGGKSGSYRAWLDYLNGDARLAQLLPLSPPRDLAIARAKRLITLPPPMAPAPAAFATLNLPHGFSTGVARKTLAGKAAICTISARLDPLFRATPSSDQVERVWRWIWTAPALPRESEHHWLLLHGALRTRRRLHVMGLADSDSCLHCGESDSLSHALFTCPSSAAYWTFLSALLSDACGQIFTDATFSAEQILLGLPLLHADAPPDRHPFLRAVVAVAITTLWRRRLDFLHHEGPTPLCDNPQDLAAKAFTRIAERLE
jgi:hypothetical protein